MGVVSLGAVIKGRAFSLRPISRSVVAGFLVVLITNASPPGFEAAAIVGRSIRTG